MQGKNKAGRARWIDRATKDAKSLSRWYFFFTLPGFGLAIGMMFLVDSFFSQLCGPGLSAGIRDWARVTTDIGLAEQYLIPFAGGWLALEIIDRMSHSVRQKTAFWRTWLFNGVCALVLSGIILHTIKFLVGRHRPYMQVNPDVLIFSPLATHWDFHSFPSGHSQTLFSVATMLVYWKPGWTWFWYFLAAVGASTRVITLNHFASDIVAGAVLGISGTLLAIFLLRKTRFAMV